MSAGRAQRIGVFGGAFDPPHNAHIALAKAALEQFSLDALHIVPTGQAWHKARVLSAPADRLAMTRLAFEGLPRIVLDEQELQRTGPTFTIDTLEATQAAHPQAQLYLFIGADQLAAFSQWHRWRAIIEIAIICIADRAQSTTAREKFEAFKSLADRFSVLHFPLMPVSATHIRQLVASGTSADSDIARLVPEPVARYISLHQLYRSR